MTNFVKVSIFALALGVFASCGESTETPAAEAAATPATDSAAATPATDSAAATPAADTTAATPAAEAAQPAATPAADSTK
jgi:hypothetical protein